MRRRRMKATALVLKDSKARQPGQPLGFGSLRIEATICGSVNSDPIHQRLRCRRLSPCGRWSPRRDPVDKVRPWELGGSKQTPN